MRDSIASVTVPKSNPCPVRFVYKACIIEIKPADGVLNEINLLASINTLLCEIGRIRDPILSPLNA